MGFFYKFVIVFIGSTLFSLPSFGFRSSSYISNHQTFIRFPERKIVEDSNCKELIEYNIKGFSLKMSQKESLISRSFAKLPWLFVGFLGASLVWTNFIPFSIANHSNSPYPIRGEESIMTKKSHGTSESAVQSKLRWNADVKLADRIVNYNRRYAEHAGYWNQESSLFQEIEAKITSQSTEPIQFYDSVTGKLLFTAPVGRSYEEFKEESLSHGWPSFRDHEVSSFISRLVFLFLINVFLTLNISVSE